MTTILAMAPLLAVGGVAGKFIRLMPLTTIFALIMSFLIALLVTIPLSRFLLGRLDLAGGPSFMDRLTEKTWQRFLAWSQRVGLRNHLSASLWVPGGLILLILSLLLAGTLPVILYSKDDGRNLSITMELPSDTTLDQSQVCADALGDVLQHKPYLQSVVKFTGSKSPMALNSPAEALTPTRDSYLVGFSAYFTPLSERRRPAYQYLDELRPELEDRFAACPGGQLLLTPQLGGANNEDPVQILVTGPHSVSSPWSESS
jgi:multidrug efflux pump subunit AcrB